MAGCISIVLSWGSTNVIEELLHYAVSVIFFFPGGVVWLVSNFSLSLVVVELEAKVAHRLRSLEDQIVLTSLTTIVEAMMRKMMGVWVWMQEMEVTTEVVPRYSSYYSKVLDVTVLILKLHISLYKAVTYVSAPHPASQSVVAELKIL